MTKQEYIQQAWGVYWDNVKNYENHLNYYVPFSLLRINYPIYTASIQLKVLFESKEWSDLYVRPESLEGILDNNGWISINNVSYPKQSDFVNGAKIVCYKHDAVETTCNTFAEYINLQRNVGGYTHYKLIPKSKPPLYI